VWWVPTREVNAELRTSAFFFHSSRAGLLAGNMNVVGPSPLARETEFVEVMIFLFSFFYEVVSGERCAMFVAV
jgi:hypothetical protein